MRGLVTCRTVSPIRWKRGLGERVLPVAVVLGRVGGLGDNGRDRLVVAPERWDGDA